MKDQIDKAKQGIAETPAYAMGVTKELSPALWKGGRVTCEKEGNQWVINAFGCGPVRVSDRVANAIFSMAAQSYSNGRYDAFRELRELIGATP